MTDFDAARRSMVDGQIRPSDVTNYAVIEAMLWAPRERFVPKSRREIAYAGTEIEVAPGRALIEPRVLAKMIEAAEIGPDDLVLDLAPGTGYSTAVIGRIAEAVVAIEPDADLAARARQVLAELEVDNAAVSVGRPSEGDPLHGPYDVILINGAVETLPEGLADQLKDGGRLVAIFTDTGAGQCRVVTRAGKAFTDRYAFDGSAPVVEGFERPMAFEF